MNDLFIAGHKGMVGSAILRECNYLKLETTVAIKSQLDLRSETAVEEFFEKNRPKYVIMAAGVVGGIKFNSENPVQFLMDNLFMTGNVIKMSHKFGIKKLLFLGSSCIYPRECPQPIKEEYLLTSQLEPTNQWYATAKIAGIKMCQAYRKQYNCNFISAMPCNLYGINDSYDEEKSHVIPGLILKFHKAKVNKNPFVQCWGTGKALREFLYVDDLAKACILLMNRYDESEPINIGYGEEISIKDLTTLIAKIVGYDGEIRWDSNIPDGTPRKILDNTKIKKLGWKPTVELEEGLKLAYDDLKLRLIQLFR